MAYSIVAYKWDTILDLQMTSMITFNFMVIGYKGIDRYSYK